MWTVTFMLPCRLFVCQERYAPGLQYGEQNMGHGLVSQGCIAMVYGMNMERMNCDRVFNLFCLYGNVDRVGMFLPSFYCIPNSLVILCRLPADFVLSRFEFSFYIYIYVFFFVGVMASVTIETVACIRYFYSLMTLLTSVLVLSDRLYVNCSHTVVDFTIVSYA